MTDAFDIGVEAYIYGYPMLLMDLTRRVSTNYEGSIESLKGPPDRFNHAATFPDADFKEVVRPNNDTLYSSAWVDLSNEPFVLSVEDPGDRYLLLPILDMWTDVFVSPGTRTTGNKSMKFLLTGPKWDGEVPEGVEMIRAPTNMVWIIPRIQTNGKKDIDNVRGIQKGMGLTPLSRWGSEYHPDKGIVDPSIDMKSPPLKQLMDMDAKTFFETFAELMKSNPPHANDYPMIHRMRRVGLISGRSFSTDETDPETWRELERAVFEGQRMILARVKTIGIPKNNWLTTLTNLGTYGTDYLARAATAYFGLGANVKEDAVYSIAFMDHENNQLNGGKRYMIHFEKDEIPPARAFWSLTMYGDDQFLVVNPISRFAIGDRDDLRFNPDDSLDLYIQHEPPGGEKEDNWLPAPAKGFNLCLRVYWPDLRVLDGSWNPPVVTRLD